MAPHPLDDLSVDERSLVRNIMIESHAGSVLVFREIYLAEPPKAQLQPFLDAENDGNLTPDTPRPARQARCQYDVIGKSKLPTYHEAMIDLESKKVVQSEVVDTKHHAALIMAEFDDLVKVAYASPLFQAALAELELPEGFEVVVEPWPYGGLDATEDNKRYFQGLCFAQNMMSGNPDSNYYSYPIPLIPIMDAQTKEIVRVDRLATGGKGDALSGKTHLKNIIDHCKDSEYVPELVDLRKDLKPLDVLQPEGPSFEVHGSQVQWQKWKFRVAFNPREGAVIHDVRYDRRSVLYRLSISEMTVPYADPRTPFHRKQAFDFGDGGGGNCANNLSLGCDCLGTIKYFDGILTDANGDAKALPNAICLHEQDTGIGWKHTNWRTGRAVVTRNRELAVQFIITLANYEYIFAFKFDQAGGITVETRATGVVSVVNIDPGKSSDYGNVVSLGVLAQNHQHIFAVRIDPAIDGARNTVLYEESLRVPKSPETNPHGNYYKVQQTVVEESQWLDAKPETNRVVKIVNIHKKNPISGKPVGYKFMPSPTQLLLAEDDSVQARRAQFAQHHVWVTKYKDDELYAGGRYTLQSQLEIGGVSDAVARRDIVQDEDVVVWNVFGLTHNPRVEDWPVMPVETHEFKIVPADFFTGNPALDVPSNKNLSSKLVQNGAKGMNGVGEANEANGVHKTNGVNGCCKES